MKNRFIISLILLFAFCAHADEGGPYLCAGISGKSFPSKSDEFDHYLQVLDGRYVFHGEYVTDLQTNERYSVRKILGETTDIFPTPDDRFIFGMSEMMRFAQEFREKVESESKVKVRYEVPKSAAYPSAGVLDDDENKTTYRIVNVLNMKDVTYDKKSNSWSTGTVHKLCGNVKSATVANQTPMISKDGRFVAFNSFGTVIFKLDSSGNCTAPKNLNIPTSKVSFSPDGKYLAFAANTYKRSGEHGFPYVPTNQIFIYNLETGQVLPVTNVSLGSAPFASFSSDGKLIFKQKNLRGGSELIVVEPDIIKNAFAENDCSTQSLSLNKLRSLAKSLCRTPENISSVSYDNLGKTEIECNKKLAPRFARIGLDPQKAELVCKSNFTK